MSRLIDFRGYLGSPNLKRVGIQVALKESEVEQFIKCSEDPTYFIENFVKIITVDKGFVNVNLYDFQKKAIDLIHDNRRVVIKAGRQVGKTTLVVGYILWYILFNEDKTVAILANKAKTSREILNRIKLAYESLPLWIQQGIKTWNKGDIELENNCRILAESTASSAVRGYSINCIYIDEFAFVPTNIAEEFFTSVYPTISSGETSKIFISSTPNGMNHFYRMWTEAVEGKNGFITFEANWRDVPGRDEAWAEDQRRALGDEKFNQEMETEFIGSAGTLISSTYLKRFSFSEAVKKILDGLDIYEEPQENHSYVMTVDTARGNGLDSSAFIIVDVSVKPYTVVAKYKNNYISPYLYPNIIYQAAKYYNEAYVLVENNDTGGQVADTLYNDLEYENMFFSESRSGETELSSKTSLTMGIRTTNRVKTLGCNALKSLIESKLVHFEDFDIISELSCFVLQKNGKYAAEKGKHDDLVMCLILFAWTTMQPFFRDLTDSDIRKKIYEDQMKRYEEQMVVPIFSANLDEFEDKYGIAQEETLDGDLWFS